MLVVKLKFTILKRSLEKNEDMFFILFCSFVVFYLLAFAVLNKLLY